ncbi:MAG: hypothetical protein CMK92_02350 [Pseudomonas sp.]|nr:hypothetical protein [Pseudomonas sp.]
MASEDNTKRARDDEDADAPAAKRTRFADEVQDADDYLKDAREVDPELDTSPFEILISAERLKLVGAVLSKMNESTSYVVVDDECVRIESGYNKISLSRMTLYPGDHLKYVVTPEETHHVCMSGKTIRDMMSIPSMQGMISMRLVDNNAVFSPCGSNGEVRALLMDAESYTSVRTEIPDFHRGQRVVWTMNVKSGTMLEETNEVKDICSSAKDEIKVHIEGSTMRWKTVYGTFSYSETYMLDEDTYGGETATLNTRFRMELLRLLKPFKSDIEFKMTPFAGITTVTLGDNGDKMMIFYRTKED